MKDPISIVVTRGAGGLEVQHMGLSCGEARAAFDSLCLNPKPDTTDILLFEKLRANKRRKLTQRSVPTLGENPWTAPVAKVKAKLVRKGR